MRAIVTSIGEPTTDLCVWALQRNGFDVSVLRDGTTLAQKLKRIYNETDEPFLRVDADIIVNRHMTPTLLDSLYDEVWWWQFLTFDWYKQDTTHSLSYITPRALPVLRANIDRFLHHLRPETMVSRISELHDPRRMETYDQQIVGIHGYGIKDVKSVIKLKANRGQSHHYDFELAHRLDEL